MLRHAASEPPPPPLPFSRNFTHVFNIRRRWFPSTYAQYSLDENHEIARKLRDKTLILLTWVL